MNCYECDNSPPADFLDSEHQPSLIRGEFKVTGSKYGLVIGRNVPVSISMFDYNEATETYSLESYGWTSLTLTFDSDSDVNTEVKATHILPVVNQGAFDPSYVSGMGIEEYPDIDTSERFAAVFPGEELNKLDGLDWIMAELTTNDGYLISRCAFKVLGGQ